MSKLFTITFGGALIGGIVLLLHPETPFIQVLIAGLLVMIYLHLAIYQKEEKTIE